MYIVVKTTKPVSFPSKSDAVQDFLRTVYGEFQTGVTDAFWFPHIEYAYVGRAELKHELYLIRVQISSLETNTFKLFCSNGMWYVTDHDAKIYRSLHTFKARVKSKNERPFKIDKVKNVCT